MSFSKGSGLRSSKACRSCSARCIALLNTVRTAPGFRRLLPHLAGIADDLTIVRSMTTEQFNHAPAQLLMHTGSQFSGSGASLGAWATYGLGTLNQDLPGFMVLVSGGNSPDGGKSMWGSAFLPGVYQGVQCRTSGDPILFVENPPGMSREVRRRSLDALADLNRTQANEFGSARDAGPHRTIRAGVSHAGFRAGGDGYRPRIAGDDRRLRRHARAGIVCEQLSARPAIGRARRAVRAALRLGLGRPWHRGQRRPGASTSEKMPGDRPPAGGTHQRLENVADCWTKRSSSGAASLAARR